MTPRKRVVEGPRAPTLRGGGARAVGSSSNAGVFSRRGNGVTTRGVRADRVGVLPAHGRSQGRAGEGPWPVKPRRVAVGAVARGFGPVPCGGQRCPCSVRSEASGARERTLAPRSRTRGGDQAVGGRARGSSWLQKSTSGAWSWPKGHGSSPLAPLLTQASSAGESAPEAGSRRRKPPAREQRHRWRAPRDPTRTRASGARARGREHSAMEGVLAWPGPLSLTRRRPGRAWRPEAMGMRQRCRIRRGRTRTSEVMSQARPVVENTAGGRFGAEEPSIGLRQDCAGPHA
jgi:hypothetical protein